MRRLIFATQKLDPDDPVLAATVPMVRALAARVDELVVLCDSAVPAAVPANARVREFGARVQAERGARFTTKKQDSLMLDAGIVRNRLKVESAVKNARAFLRVQEEFGSFSEYQWRFVDGVPIQGGIRTKRDIVPRTAVSDTFSRDLKKRGFSFVGSTIIYAHMQAVGMVNDHLVECFRHAPLSGKSKGRK